MPRYKGYAYTTRSLIILCNKCRKNAAVVEVNLDVLTNYMARYSCKNCIDKLLDDLIEDVPDR